MANAPRPREEYVQMVEAVRKYGSDYKAAEALGLSRSTVHNRLKAGRERYGEVPESPPIEMPIFPDDDLPVEQLIDIQSRRFTKRQEHVKAQKWFPIKVKIDGPIGLSWFGDPHVDDDGCNWPLLNHHIELHRKHKALFAANIGDTTNNWAGRLERLFAHQETSQKTARKIAKWFLCDSGVKWLLWLKGNHDVWGDGGEILTLMNTTHIPMKDWEARFRIVFPNGREAKTHASHNFSGNSIWNSLHGPQKAAHTKAEAHVYVCGHTHNWAIHQEESASREFVYWLVRARGYKFIDDFAVKLGHAQQQEGAAITLIFNPDSKTETGFVQAYADMDAAVDYLAFLRRKL